MEKATFAAGCFWGIEAAFAKVKGVKSTAVGYSGGTKTDPTYEEVCTGKTGHAEVVQVEFDPNEVSYRDLLELFWQIHDPTSLNRQGFDIGTQYRSAIFAHSPEQAEAARDSKAEHERAGTYRDPIVTEITPFEAFWRAEDYHQKYFSKHGHAI